MEESHAGGARWVLLSLGAGCLAYLNSLGAGFVYDDNSQIVDNPWVHELGSLPRLLTHTVWAFKTSRPVHYYRPVQMGLYNLLWALSGGTPFLFHAVNLLLHLGVVLLLFLLIRRLSRDGRVAAAGALLFAVHPLATETVDWVACVPELTYALFGLLALNLHAASWDAAPPRRGWLRTSALLALLLSLLSKETALIFLPALLLMEGLLGRAAGGDRPGETGTGARLGRVLAAGTPYALGAAAYLALRLAVMGGIAPMRRPDLTAIDAVLNAPSLLLRYLGMMAAPVRLVAHHVLEPLPSFARPAFLVSAGGAALLLVLVAWLARRAPDLGFAAALALLPILPVLYLPALTGFLVSERYAYLPSAGFAWLVAGLLAAASGKLHPARGRAIFLAAVGLLAAAGAVRTATRNPVWHDDGALASATLRDEPRAWEMYVLLGAWHEREGRLEEALRVYETGARAFPGEPQLAAAVINARLKIHRIGPAEAIRDYLPLAAAYPSFYDVQYNLGDAYLKDDRPADAETAFRRAILLGPGRTQAREGLMLALIAQGKVPEGEEAEEASRSPAARSRALLLQGIAQMKQGRLEEARSLLDEAHRLDPASERVLLSLAVLESQQGDDHAALKSCREALALDPSLIAAYEQMGVSALHLGDLPEAIRNLETATRLDPDNKEALSRLGVIYAEAGRLEEARKAFERALALDPDFEKARHNLAHLHELEGKKGP